MKTFRNLSLVVGLLMAIAGLSICVDTAFAAGCGCCCSGGCCGEPNPCGSGCGSEASAETKACATGPSVPLCSGSSTMAGCTDGFTQHYEVKDFPASCFSFNDNNVHETLCNQPNADCQRPTSCKWDPMANNGMGACLTLTGTADWTPATKPTTVACTR